MIEREKVEGYLAHKWGLDNLLPNSHSAKHNPTIQSPKDLESYEVDLSGLTEGQTYYYRVAASNSATSSLPYDLKWSDQTASFTSENSLDISTGSITFNTDGSTPIWFASRWKGGTACYKPLAWTDEQSNTIQYKVAKFSFKTLNIGDGVKVKLVGNNPIHLDINGDATINAVLDANGSHGNTGYLTEMVTGKLGGGEGGYSWSGTNRLSDFAVIGSGPAHLVGSSPFNSGGARKKYGTTTGLVAGEAAGGGSYGGSGARSEPSGGSDSKDTHPITGGTYGNINVDALLAGSGGGGGWMAKGGTGGGAIKITAGGTLTIGADIFANGGQGGSHAGDITDNMGGTPQFWFDASDLQSVTKDANGKVIYWKDKVSTRHLKQATSANQPTHGSRLSNGKTCDGF